MIDKQDINLLKGLCGLSEFKILKLISDFLIQKEYTPFLNEHYLLAEGNIPILLVAHADTVFPKTPREIYYDSEKNVMWSPSGLGADDRAGIFGIVKILQHKSNLRPHVLLTTGEECGGIGVSQLITDFPQHPFQDLKYIIELDRQGFNECVFYNCDNQDFVNYIISFDFIEEIGLFSDISILCPAWGIAGVNLSIGYFEEHSYSERLFLNKTFDTIDKIITMLQSSDEAEHFAYFSNTEADLYNIDIDFCDICHQKYPDSGLMVGQAVDSTNTVFYAYVCPSCAKQHFQRCKNCGTDFIDSNKNDYCYVCRKETK